MRSSPIAIGLVCWAMLSPAPGIGAERPDVIQLYADHHAKKWSRMIAGTEGSMGFSAARDDERDDSTSRFTGGGRVYFGPWWMDSVGLELGVGLMDRGYALGQGCGDEGVCTGWIETKVLYLEVPLDLKLQYRGFRIGARASFDVALWGRTDEMGEDLVQWDGLTYMDGRYQLKHRRVNMGLAVHAGYAFKGSRATIIPGISYFTHASDEIESTDHPWREPPSFRYKSLMVDVAVELTWYEF